MVIVKLDNEMLPLVRSIRQETVRRFFGMESDRIIWRDKVAWLGHQGGNGA